LSPFPYFFQHIYYSSNEEGNSPLSSCDGSNSQVLGDVSLADISPYLFPCAIEFALIGAAFSFSMWKKVGKM
jgi:hypothetical protein